MQLILVRHAEPESGASYAEDALRPLTAKGRVVQGGVAQALANAGLVPDVVLSSPRVRAMQTAEITAEGLNASLEVEELQVLDGGYSVDALVEALQRYPADSTVMCVGHEPDMSYWAASLLADPQRPPIQFGKSSVGSILFDGLPAAGTGRLDFFKRVEMW